MSKKKFSQTKVGKFLLDKGSNLFNVVGDVLPDNGVLGVVKNLIDKDNTMPQQDKDIALELIKQDQIEMQEVTKRWVADASAGWLQANVRPLTLIFFSVAYVVGWYLDYPLESITGLLSLIVGAYFGSVGS